MQAAFSLRWLFALVAAVGVGCLALRGASYTANGYLLLGVLAMLGLALTGALVTSGRSRAVWGGAAVFGWMTFLIHGPASSLTSNVQLPTNQAIDFLHAKAARSFAPEEAVRSGLLPADALRIPMMAPRVVQVPNAQYFQDAAHHLMTLGAMAIGGLIGRYLYRKSENAGEGSRVAR